MMDEPGINAIISNFRDISQLKKMQQQQDFDKNNLDALINNTKDLMWSVNRDFKLITSNQPFNNLVKQLSGKSILTGSNVLEALISNNSPERYKHLYMRAFAGETFTEIEYSSEPEFWMEISCSRSR